MKKIRKPDNDIEPILNNCIMRMKNPRKGHIELVKEKIIEKRLNMMI